jgi:hypothetical protein
MMLALRVLMQLAFRKKRQSVRSASWQFGTSNLLAGLINPQPTDDATAALLSCCRSVGVFSPARPFFLFSGIMLRASEGVGFVRARVARRSVGQRLSNCYAPVANSALDQQCE